MMDTSGAVAAVASATSIAAFILYDRHLLRGTSAPKIVSWLVWSFITVLNFTSYGEMSGDLWMTLLPTIESMLCILTFVLLLFVGRWTRMSRVDAVVLVLGVTAGVVWLLFRAASSANLVVQSAIAIGFLPTVRSVWENPSNEPSLPWFLWTAAFSLGLLVVILRWGGRWQDAVYYVSCILFHAGVWLLALRPRTPAMEESH